MHFLTRVRHTAERHAMLPDAGKIVAAVSGGPDSMALLEGLALILGDQSRQRLVVAHLDHGLRVAAREDAEFVRDEADSRGLEFILGREDVGALARDRKLSIEEAARKARYAFLGTAASEAGAGVVAIGHTADDNAETVFLNIFRGAGLRGLAGIRPVRVDTGDDGSEVNYVRPLIEVTRADIEAFLKERGVPFRTDETNVDTRFRRNLVRHELLPAVRRGLGPRATEALCRLAEAASEARDFVEGEAARHTGEVRAGEAASVSRAAWERVPSALRGSVLRLMFESASGGRTLSHAHVEALRELVGSGEALEGQAVSGGETDLPGGWAARVSGEGLTLVPPREQEGARKGAEETPPWRVLLPVPGRAALPDGRVLVAELNRRASGEHPPRREDPSLPEEWADHDALGRPRELVVRSREPGDVFRPLGAPGAKSVKRFLIDLKVPREERSRVPIVMTMDEEGDEEGGIVWVAPYRIAERARVTEDTRDVLALRLDPPSSAEATEGNWAP